MAQERVFYTDGACLGNPGPGGWAWVEYAGGREVDSGSGAEPSMTTNNRMELMAVIRVLQAANGASGPITVRTDSTYVANGMGKWLQAWKRRGWKTAAKTDVANRDLWEQLDALVQGHGDVRFAWVKGHAQDEGNNAADRYAQQVALAAERMMAAGKAP